MPWHCPWRSISALLLGAPPTDWGWRKSSAQNFLRARVFCKGTTPLHLMLPSSSLAQLPPTATLDIEAAIGSGRVAASTLSQLMQILRRCSAVACDGDQVDASEPVGTTGCSLTSPTLNVASWRSSRQRGVAHSEGSGVKAPASGRRARHSGSPQRTSRPHRSLWTPPSRESELRPLVVPSRN